MQRGTKDRIDVWRRRIPISQELALAANLREHIDSPTDEELGATQANSVQSADAIDAYQQVILI